MKSIFCVLCLMCVAAVCSAQPSIDEGHLEKFGIAGRAQTPEESSCLRYADISELQTRTHAQFQCTVQEPVGMIEESDETNNRSPSVTLTVPE